MFNINLILFGFNEICIFLHVNIKMVPLIIFFFIIIFFFFKILIYYIVYNFKIPITAGVKIFFSLFLVIVRFLDKVFFLGVISLIYVCYFFSFFKFFFLYIGYYFVTLPWILIIFELLEKLLLLWIQIFYGWATYPRDWVYFLLYCIAYFFHLAPTKQAIKLLKKCLSFLSIKKPIKYNLLRYRRFFLERTKWWPFEVRYVMIYKLSSSLDQMPKSQFAGFFLKQTNIEVMINKNVFNTERFLDSPAKEAVIVCNWQFSELYTLLQNKKENNANIEYFEWSFYVRSDDCTNGFSSCHIAKIELNQVNFNNTVECIFSIDKYKDHTEYMSCLLVIKGVFEEHLCFVALLSQLHFEVVPVFFDDLFFIQTKNKIVSEYFLGFKIDVGIYRTTFKRYYL